jgi:hypothetical protein
MRLTLVVGLPAIAAFLLASTYANSARAESGYQTINGTRVFTVIDHERGVATFSNSCGSQTLTQQQLQAGAIPSNIIPCNGAPSHSTCISVSEMARRCQYSAQVLGRLGKLHDQFAARLAKASGNYAELCRLGREQGIPLDARTLAEAKAIPPCPPLADLCSTRDPVRDAVVAAETKRVAQYKKLVEADCRRAAATANAKGAESAKALGADSGKPACSGGTTPQLCVTLEQRGHSGPWHNFRLVNACNSAFKVNVFACDANWAGGCKVDSYRVGPCEKTGSSSEGKQSWNRDAELRW